MTIRPHKVIRRRALRVEQDPKHPVYLFALTPAELFQIAEISRVGRSEAGELLGYQRPEVKAHVKNIVEYLDSKKGKVLFPNTLILALSSDASFKAVRGPRVDDGLTEAGTLEIRVPHGREPKPAWIVDGQQRALALSRCKNKTLAIPVSAFIADDVETQREQFLRVNSTKPLPRGLISELLPEVNTVLPAKLAIKKAPAAICEILNRSPESPFFQLVKRSSLDRNRKKTAIIADTVLIQMIEDSFNSPTGCLFAYRNIATGETDFERVQRLLITFWSAAKHTWPSAWGKPPTESRLMHSVGLKAVGRLMDRVMANINVDDKDVLDRVKAELAPLRTKCHWTSGEWDELGGIAWNELQNVPNHLRALTNFLQRAYLEAHRHDE